MKWFFGVLMFLLLGGCIPAEYVEIQPVVVTVMKIDTIYRFNDRQIQITMEAKGVRYISYASDNVYVQKGSRALLYLKR